MHEGGFRLAFAHGAVTLSRPDGTVLDSESLVPQGPDIAEQNRAARRKITPQTIVPEWDGRRLTPELLADTVTALLWKEGRFRREVEAMQKVREAAAVRVGSLDGLPADYPEFIVIDDYVDEEDDLDFA